MTGYGGSLSFRLKFLNMSRRRKTGLPGFLDMALEMRSKNAGCLFAWKRRNDAASISVADFFDDTL